MIREAEGLGLRVDSAVLVDGEHEKPWVPSEPPRSVTLKHAYRGQPIIGEPYTVTLSDGSTLYSNSEECVTAYFLLKHGGQSE